VCKFREKTLKGKGGGEQPKTEESQTRPGSALHKPEKERYKKKGKKENMHINRITYLHPPGLTEG